MPRRYSHHERTRRFRPKEVLGGIKAQSLRGEIGETWWSRRWIAALEGLHAKARLDRGKSYARRGQVLSIEVGKGKVAGKVQGSRAVPYSVKIAVPTFTKSQWKTVADALRDQALFAAKLLAGEMPEAIESAFQAAGLSLFPGRLPDLRASCSCSDRNAPCTHAAAVYYLLAEEFDRDPFLLFLLRGMPREELTALLGGGTVPARKRPPDAAPPAGPEPGAAPREAPCSAPVPPSATAAPPADSCAFWGRTDLPEDIAGEVEIPQTDAALARRLGKFPFWRGEQDLLSALEASCRAASPAGMAVVLGEGKGGRFVNR
jgi:uncharacterized Zn finger protein